MSKALAPTLESPAALTASATGKTNLPLSDRDVSWDAGEAEQSMSEAQYSQGHFWVDPEGDPATLAAYKLPFASAAGGTLTAIWSGVTACAGAIQGARGGVQIPEADVADVKSKIAAYYTKASDQYDDPNIKPPWNASAEDAQAIHEALGLDGQASTDPDDVAVYALAYAESAVDLTGFSARAEFWTPRISERFQHTTSCSCKHTLAEHLGVDGPCTHEDGRGRCRCTGFAELAITAAGEMVWAPEDGFKDLLADATEQLCMYEGGYCAKDITLALDKVLVHCEETEDHWVAPITVDSATGDIMVAPIGEWVEVDRAWVTEDSEYAVVAAAVDEAIPAEHQPGETLPTRTAGPPAPITEQPVNATMKRWEATICPEAELTDDGRAFAPGAISWRDLPLSLAAMLETAEGHDGAEVCGRIDRIWREGNLLRASGVFDEGDYGQEIARMVGEGTLRGVSVDLAVREFEVGSEADFFDENGNWHPTPAAEDDGPDLLDILFGGEDSIFVVTDAVIGMVTVCPFPAFADATIALTAAAKWTVTFQSGITVTEEEPPADDTVAETRDESLTASVAIPVEPPAEWFTPPNLDELTPLVVTPEGRVYGHAAAWDTCHIGIPDVCTTAPHSNANYDYFHLGEVECEDGERIACGKITLGTGHADKHLGFRDAMAHYDNTGTAVADVICGEDEFGLWVSGALRPTVDAATVRELRAAVPSGDWRNVNGNLELIALLAVNVPGFPVPRQRALIASLGEGDDETIEVLALVAAGHVFSTELFTDVEKAAIAGLVAAARGELEVDEFAELAARAVTAAALRPSPDEFAELAAKARG